MKGEKKNQWVDEVMGSLSGMRKAEPNPYLYQKVMSRLQGDFEKKTYRGYFRPAWVLTAIVILGINGLSFFRLLNKESAHQTPAHISIFEITEQSTYNY